MDIIARFLAIRRGCRNLIFWALVFTVFAVAMCRATAVHGQDTTHFAFNSTWIKVTNTAGPSVQVDSADASFPVRAWADWLRAEITGMPVELSGIEWTKTNSGALYYNRPGLSLKYDPGPGGAYLMIKRPRLTIELWQNKPTRI